ncbi:hypothetical protein GQX74_011728 [Glossina fuscipes]|nr:hypothetical protein GQX74_011728 [Glossina fuscipes]
MWMCCRRIILLILSTASQRTITQYGILYCGTLQPNTLAPCQSYTTILSGYRKPLEESIRASACGPSRFCVSEAINSERVVQTIETNAAAFTLVIVSADFGRNRTAPLFILIQSLLFTAISSLLNLD